ncbi:beta-lactamase family protein [SAR86 cluster bacterium]|nr:beta-lactamase family protein [SAR86 cluster bacterium]
MEKINQVIEAALEESNIPYAAYAVTNSKETLFSGSVGYEDLKKTKPLETNAIFRIASMTKALTTSAFMILAKEKELDLHSPAENYIDNLKSLQVASVENDEIIYSEPETKVTLHQLLTHTSGFGYDFHHETLSHLLLDKKIVDLLDKEGKFLEAPLIEQPGKYWHYGIGLGWIGRIIETLSEQSLNDYMTEKLFKPLEMSNTSFDISTIGEDRLPKIYSIEEDGSLIDISELMSSPQIDKFAYGGGGVFSCPDDYAKFLRMFLNGGKANGENVLSIETVKQMTTNQIGELNVPFQPTFNSSIIAPNEWFPGIEKKWGYSFMINSEDVPNRRTKGSCAWSGIMNTFFWFDQQKDIGGTIMMQIAPCYHEKPKQVLKRFEEAIYKSI